MGAGDLARVHFGSDASGRSGPATAARSSFSSTKSPSGSQTAENSTGMVPPRRAACEQPHEHESREDAECIHDLSPEVLHKRT
jgi:hypothetical protein